MQMRTPGRCAALHRKKGNGVQQEVEAVGNEGGEKE
jgi:hypothetical protein